MRFVLRMAARELRSSWRRLLFFFICVAVGVGAIVALRSIALLAVGMDSFRERALAGLEADEQRIGELVDRSLMLVTALATEIGYDDAAAIAKHAHKKGLTLKQAGLELGLVDEATFDRVVRPELMIGR